MYIEKRHIKDTYQKELIKNPSKDNFWVATVSIIDKITGLICRI